MKIRKRAALLVLVIYGGVYCFLSAAGEYESAYTGIYYIDGSPLIVDDSIIWQPLFIKNKRYVGGSKRLSANFLGRIFHPLILFDRDMVHKDKIIKPIWAGEDMLKLQND